MKPLADIKAELKGIVPDGLDKAFDAVKIYLREGTDTFNALILLESRYRANHQKELQGVISSEDAQLEWNQVLLALLQFIDDLQESHLKSNGTPLGESPTDVYNGEVLHRIPNQMQLNEETKCIVRVAFDRASLTQDLELTDEDVIKDIRISEEMGVELLDMNPDKPFEIRTPNETVQFVDKGLPTEWWFFVKPLKEGKFPLLLKISVIEIRNGKERKREVVLEEIIQVVAVAVKEDKGQGKLTTSGVHFQTSKGKTIPIERAKPSSTVRPPSPVSPAPQPAIPRQIGGGGFRRIAAAAAVLALFASVTWALWNYFSDAPDKEEWTLIEKKNSRKDYEDFVKKFPESEYAPSAIEKLDSLETSYWDAAVASNDTTQIRRYTIEYPGGKYYDTAIKMLEKVNVPIIEQLYFDAVIEKDSLKLNFRGGKSPHTFIFNQNGKPVYKNSATAGQALKLPLKTLQPGTYEIILQDAAGSDFVDTLIIEPIKPTPNTPVSKTPKKPKKPAANTNKPPSNTPNTTAENKTPEVTPPVETPTNKPVELRLADRKPIFKGCDNTNKADEEKCTNTKIQRFLRDRIKYPPEAVDKNISGTCLIEFVVERDGKISDAEIVRDIGYGCGAEALRLVNSLPQFKPGLDARGNPIRVRYRQPVVFKLEN